MPETVTEPVEANPGADNLTPGNGKPGSSATKARECLVLQDSLKEIALDESRKPLERTSAARVWKEIDQHRRFILGLPNPAPVKTEPKQARSRQSTGPMFSEPKPTGS